MVSVQDTYLAPQDLVDGGRLLQRTFLYYLRPHLLHEEHERVEGLLYVGLLTLLLLLLHVGWGHAPPV